MPRQAPDTFFGVVQPGDTLVPTADMPVIARVDGNVCGESSTQEADGTIIYVIEVAADEAGVSDGCGAAGRTVTFQVGDQMMATTAEWDSSDAENLTLQAESQQETRTIHLPMIMR
ncbi:MAG: hypothetical protein HC884_03955 [Chloroflexaceae bacterium]|nr:hypothetical protein [Chloroflexaceae bacterium]